MRGRVDLSPCNDELEMKHEHKGYVTTSVVPHHSAAELITQAGLESGAVASRCDPGVDQQATSPEPLRREPAGGTQTIA